MSETPQTKGLSELTFRAVLSGLFVGCLIGASNVTIGLKIGWTFGAGITAAVISFAVFSTMRRMRRPFDEKENLIAATAGSSSGTMASAGGFVAAIPALEMIRANAGDGPLPFLSLVVWGMSVAFLGVHFAVPLRRQMIVTEKLRYPTGTATAETIKAMYASGAEALKKTKVLAIAGIFAAAVKLLYLAFPDTLGALEDLSTNDIGLAGLAIASIPLYQLHIGINLSPMMLGAGVLIGPKVGWSLLAGAIIAWGIITPVLIDNGTVEIAPDFAAVRAADAALDNNGGQGKATRELEQALDHALVRLERLAGNRVDEGVDAMSIVEEYTHHEIHLALQKRLEQLTSLEDLRDERAELAPLIKTRLQTARLFFERLEPGSRSEWPDLDSWLNKDLPLFIEARLAAGMLEATARQALSGEDLTIDDLGVAASPYTRVGQWLTATPWLSPAAALRLDERAGTIVTEAAMAESEGRTWLSLEQLHEQRKIEELQLAWDLPETTSPYRAGFNWVLWTGVALMITASFTSLAMQYKTIARTFSSLKKATGRAGAEPVDPDEEPDAPDPYPMKPWAIGMGLATLLTVVLANLYFSIPVWAGLLAVVLSFLIASIAVRATGETDINPVGAMGKITQVVFGALQPGLMQINLMSAAITSAGASQAGDLMQDMKAGYMLKVSIRRQVITQLIGVVVGVFAAAATFRVLTLVYEIPGKEFPGPAVFAWYKMAEILAVGLEALPPGALTGALVGGLLGIALPLLAKASPKLGKWLPSPVAFGIAFMVPAVYSIGMWLGAIITQIVNKRRPQQVEKYGASLASGFIAGEGLMMVAFAIYLMLTQVVF